MIIKSTLKPSNPKSFPIFLAAGNGLCLTMEISTPEEAIEAIAAKSSLKREEIAHIFNLRTEMMFPLDQNVRLLPELKKRGFQAIFSIQLPD